MDPKLTAARARSNRNPRTPASLAPSEPLEGAELKAIEDLIEEERARLMNAETILHCVAVAMEQASPPDSQDPCYQNVIGVARDLILQSVNQLDSVRLRPMLEAAGASRKFAVRECTTEYVH